MLREIIKELFYEQTRAILIILAVAWGTFAIVITLAVGDGLRLNFVQTMSDIGSRILVLTSGTSTKNYQGILANQSIKLTKRDAKAIADLPNLSSVTWRYNFQTKLRYQDKKTYADLRAVTPEYVLVHKVKTGPKQRFISYLDQKKMSSVIVLGSDTADRLFIKDNPVGNIVYVDNHPFTIIGVMQKRPQMIYADSVPDRWLNWIPSSTYELLNNPDKVDAIEVRYKDVGLIEQTKNSIQKLIAINHGADPSDPGIVDFQDVAQKQKKINNFFINMEIFLGIVGGLTLFLAGVGIANVMYASVKRATRQIGIQMALGATARYVVFRYIMESLVMTVIGGVIGMVVAVVFVYFVNRIPLQGQILEWTGKPELSLSFLVLSIVVLVLGVTGLLAGLFPALKAAKIDPAEALTYE